MTRHISATDDPIPVQQCLAESMETIGEEIPRIPTTQRVVENEQVELIDQGSDVDSALTILTEKDGGSQKTDIQVIPRIPTTQRVIGQVFIPIVENEEFGLTSIINQGSDVDSASTILTETELNDYTEPKGKAFSLATYIPLILLIRAIGVSLAHPLLRISVAIFVVAFLNISSLTFAYYVLKNSPQRQYFSPRLYVILNFSYYILWFLAHVLLVPVIFISHDH